MTRALLLRSIVTAFPKLRPDHRLARTQSACGQLQKGISAVSRNDTRDSLYRRTQQRSFAAGQQQQKDGHVKLYLYSKPGCHLCEGLHEKLDAAIAKAHYLPSRLTSAEVQVRDITTNAEWERAYGLVIPVLTAEVSGHSREVKIPRPPPKLSADRLAKHIEEHLP